MTATKTLEQLRNEAADAAAALACAQHEAELAEKAAQEAARLQKQRDEREAHRNMPEPAAYIERAQHLEQIAHHIITTADNSTDLKGLVKAIVVPSQKRVTEDDELGPSVDWSAPSLVVTLRGEDVYMTLDWKAEEKATSRYSYRTQTTGRMRCTVGQYGSRTSYPSKKDGTFNYSAITSCLFSIIRAAEADYQRTVLVTTNAGTLKALKKEFAIGDYSEIVAIKGSHRSGNSYHEYAAPEGRVFLKLIKTVTVEQARTILKAAQDAGVLF